VAAGRRHHPGQHPADQGGALNGLFHCLTSEETLKRIQEWLAHGVAPAVIIEELLPQSCDDAFCWARRLSGWEEYQRQYPAQVIALARVISQRAMRQFGLTLREDGRVVEQPEEGKPWKTPKPAALFRLEIGEEAVRVEYTPGYFPNADTDLLYFVSLHDPPWANALSDTGYYSCFVAHDAIEACGGPEAYAALLAEAILRGEEKAFTEAFEGQRPETDRQRRQQANRPAPAPGGHAERVSADPEASPQPPRQRMLF
jgi:hypothetical protein